MKQTSRIAKAIVFSAVAAVAASALVLLVGACVFGFALDQWAEGQGRLIGVIGTIAGVTGAAAGLWLALRSEPRVIH